MLKSSVFTWVSLLLLLIGSPSVRAEKCLFINSYHQGYAWSDGIEHGVKRVIGEKCELRVHYMDTKRKHRVSEIKQSADATYRLIEEWEPDIIIAADDIASKYVIVPHYKNGLIPIVFCGINWSGQEYGYPFDNATGMIEVSPVTAIINTIRKIQGHVTNGLFISADVLSEQKDYQRMKKLFSQQSIRLDAALVSSMSEWEQAYQRAKKFDFVILNNNAGINDWDDGKAKAITRLGVGGLSVTGYEWMMPYAVLGITKLAEEQGEWAAMVALDILKGTSPNTIPVVPNRKYNMWINQELAKMNAVDIPDYILFRAHIFR